MQAGLTLSTNRLQYIRQPVPAFAGFLYEPWSEIFPAFKGETEDRETEFFANLIQSSHAKDLVDLCVGAGADLNALLGVLAQRAYTLDAVAGVDIDALLLEKAAALFGRSPYRVSLHQADWAELPRSTPGIESRFDFALLTGNSLTHYSTGDRAGTRRMLRRIARGLRALLRPGASLFVDTRNFDFIRTLRDLELEDIVSRFQFEKSVYYHGAARDARVFPAYISDTLVVLHYYDLRRSVWSANDFFPIYERDMVHMLSADFHIERTYYDFSLGAPGKSLFLQFLATAKE